MNIFQSTKRYEDWLRQQLDDVVEEHLVAKHKKMAESPFEFLRATYWRFAETILTEYPGLKSAPQALAVGDIHVENFGTWRDGDGRLVWGVNDYDEAARMPYVLDIVRLAASAALAMDHGLTDTAICEAVTEGYCRGLKAPRPFVLDRDHDWLRHKVIVRDGEREKFWDKFDPARIAKDKPEKVDPVAPEELRRRYRKAIERAQPRAMTTLKFYSREAGTGSLGHPRYFGVGEWQGDLVVREAKAMTRSAWARVHGGGHRLRCAEIATGLYRSADPTYRLRGHVVVRRLSPNDFKIEVEQPKQKGKAKKKKDEKVKSRAPRELISTEMLSAMGHELASIHRATLEKDDIEADFEARKSGLAKLVTAVSKAIAREQKEWKAHPAEWPRPTAKPA
jgi:uncharacterized protein (DUF2252 family)